MFLRQTKAYIPSFAFVCIIIDEMISIFMCGLYIDYTKLLGGTCYAFTPAARRMVEEAIDHGTVTVHQNRSSISILLVSLHPDKKQQQHAL